eukprot:scaffold48005_cov31-Tisochrysis_lutea.AAC.5
MRLGHAYTILLIRRCSSFASSRAACFGRLMIRQRRWALAWLLAIVSWADTNGATPHLAHTSSLTSPCCTFSTALRDRRRFTREPMVKAGVNASRLTYATLCDVTCSLRVHCKRRI